MEGSGRSFWDLLWHRAQQPFGPVEDAGRPPLVARDQEFDRLRDLAMRPGQLAAIVGRRGTGKTALLYRLADELRGRGVKHVLIAGTAGFRTRGELDERIISAPEDLRGAVVIVDDADFLAPKALLDLIETAAAAPASLIVALASHSTLSSIGLPRNANVIELRELSSDGVRHLVESRFPEGDIPADLLNYALTLRGTPREVLLKLNDFVNQRLKHLSSAKQGEPLPAKSLGPLELEIELGEATAEDVAEFMLALSGYYRSFGGRGLVFGETDVVVLIPEVAG